MSTRLQKLVWMARRKYIVLREKRPEGMLIFDWNRIDYSRTDLIKALLTAYPSKKYLEIGCQGDKNFKNISAPLKIGVDPAAGGTHRMTSDRFFAENIDTFDFVFIDGLHTYEQARRDVVNSLKVLDTGGIIVIHDMLPASWEQERVPRANPIWNGTVWKVAYELVERFGAKFGIVAANHGLGVIFKDADGYKAFDDADIKKFSAKTYDDFVKDRSGFHIIEVKDVPDFIKKRSI